MKKTVRLKRILLLVTLIVSSLSFGQHKSQKDTLRKYTYKELSEKYYAAKSDSLKAVLYAKYYIKKAQKEKDTVENSKGHFYLTDITKDYNYFIKFWKNIINVQSKLTNKYPLINSFCVLGDFHLQKGNYKVALDNFFLAKKNVKKIKNDSIYYHIIKRIGIIKNWQGNTKGAIKDLKKVFKYYLDNEKRNSLDYSILLLHLASYYNKIGVQDSAKYYNTLNRSSGFMLKDSITYGYTIYINGKIQFELYNYLIAIENFKKALPYINKDYNYSTVSSIYLYLGKSYNFLNDKKKSLLYFKKIDSIKYSTNIIHKSQKPTYKFLANYYKEKNNDKKQLEYINKYIKVDSVLRSRAKNIDKSLTENYDIPNLKAEKKILEERLKKNNSTSSKIIMGMSTFTIVLALFLVYQSNKKKRYKKHFLQLKYEVSSAKNKSKEKPTKEHTIPKKVYKNILECLLQFEENADYLIPNSTLTTLSKKFETNAKYLSQVINQEKGKSFNNYINELRINYTIEKLKIDLTFRKYSIKAIANEVGFNTSESFSKAFYKNTGIRPSYFIKELDKK